MVLVAVVKKTMAILISNAVGSEAGTADGGSNSGLGGRVMMMAMVGTVTVIMMAAVVVTVIKAVVVVIVMSVVVMVAVAVVVIKMW